MHGEYELPSNGKQVSFFQNSKHFLSVRNILENSINCDLHNKNALWECVFRMESETKIKRLCVFCGAFNNEVQKNWTESMRMAVHIMRKFRVEKIESTTFENDIEDVHWEDKACLRRAFGFKAE